MTSIVWIAVWCAVSLGLGIWIGKQIKKYKPQDWRVRESTQINRWTQKNVVDLAARRRARG